MNFDRFISRAPGPEGRYNVNLYLLPETERGNPALVTTPGLTQKVTPKPNVPVRAMAVCMDKLYAVCGDELYAIDSNWNATLIGQLSGASEPTHMVAGDKYVVVVSGGKLFAYDASSEDTTISVPTTNVTPYALAYQDRYFIISKLASDYWYISTLEDPTSWDALDEGRAGAYPGAILAIVSESRQLWVFKETSIEVYYNSGDLDFPFQRVQGASQDVGTSAPRSVVSLDQSIFWLDNNGRILRSQGYGHIVISNPQIERAIAAYSRIDDATAYSLYWLGHAWYVLSFPTGNATWVYDASTQSWFRWSSKQGFSFGGRHRTMSYAYFNSEHVVGDYENGKIYVLDKDSFREDGEEIRWERYAPPLILEGRRIFVRDLYLDMSSGTTTQQSLNPQVVLRWSDDGGKTWSNEYWASVGKIGEYKARIAWRRLGSSRNRTFHVFGTDNYRAEIHGAFINVIASEDI